MKIVKNQFVFFYPDWDISHTFSIQSSRIYHQVLQVLRQKIGAEFLLLNGNGQKLYVKMIGVDKKNLYCQPLKLVQIEPEKIWIELVIGTPKKEAFKDILKYSTQLGVSCISLVDMQYSQMKSQQYALKNQYWQNILQESLEQSMRTYLPGLKYFHSLQEYKEQEAIGQFLVADISGENEHLPNLRSVVNTQWERFFIFIGSEGGFSPKERELFHSESFRRFSLSPYILRVETAAVSSLVSLQTILSSQIPR